MSSFTYFLFIQLYYPILYLGIIGSGAIYTGVNPAYTARELEHHFRLTKPKLLIVEPHMLKKTLSALSSSDLTNSTVYTFASDVPSVESCKFQDWSVLLEHGEADWVQVDDPDSTTATYVSTSGTSGLPKAAAISHSYHVSQAEHLCKPIHYRCQVSKISA